MEFKYSSNADLSIGKTVDDLEIYFARDPSDQIIDTKNWKIDQWIWKASSDGHTIMTIQNILFKALLVQDKDGIRYTDVIAQFDQYNNTQNDKGDHQCHMDLYLLDAYGQTIATPYPSLHITRDVCRSLGTIKLNAVRLDAVFFPIATNFGCSGKATWNYEGSC